MLRDLKIHSHSSHIVHIYKIKTEAPVGIHIEKNSNSKERVNKGFSYRYNVESLVKVKQNHVQILVSPKINYKFV